MDMDALKQEVTQRLAMAGVGQGITGGVAGAAVNPYNHLQQLMAAHMAMPIKLRFSVRTVVNGYIIEYAETEGQIAQEIVCYTLEELTAEVVRVVAVLKLKV